MLSVSYAGYRAYQKHIEFQALNRSIEGHYVHSSKDHTQGTDSRSSDPSELAPKAGRVESEHKHYPHAAEGKYVYKIAGFSIYTDAPMSQEDLEVEEWFITGKMTPAVEEYLKTHQKEVRLDSQVTQRVVGPDEKMYRVMVPIGQEYEEGDAILRSELERPEHLKAKPRGTAGETIHDRLAMLEPQIIPPPLSDKPPVKVSFLPNDGEGALPGWMQKMLRRSMAGLPPGALEGAGLPPGVLGGSESVSVGGCSGVSNFSEGGNTDTALEAPVSASFLPEIAESTPSRRSETGGAVSNKMPTPLPLESIGEQLSPERFDKARRLIDEYGTEEGLRRFREMDPEAARHFEGQRRGEPSRDAPKGHTHPNDPSPDDSP